MKLYRAFCLVLLIFALVGCVDKKPTPKRSGIMLTTGGGHEVSDIKKYDKIYMKEYARILKSEKKPKYMFVQPNNKKEPCKLYVASDDSLDFVNKKSYRLFWDGKCKNGYASGLGREFEKRDSKFMQQIGEYEDGISKYIVTSNENGTKVFEGLHEPKKEEYGVMTSIIKNRVDFYVYYYDTKLSVVDYVFLDPYKNFVQYAKVYPNFQYKTVDFGDDKDTDLRSSFRVLKCKKDSGDCLENGYRIDLFKSGVLKYYEYENDRKSREVNMPSLEYMDFANKVAYGIIKNTKKALKAQKKARKIYEKYLAFICDTNIKVSFMTQSRYKKICSFNKQREELRKGIVKASSVGQKNKISKKDENTIWPLNQMDFEPLRNRLLKMF